MDATEFDRLLARARDPRLISGVYNYCDGGAGDVRSRSVVSSIWTLRK